MKKENIDKLIKIGKALDNKYRRKIINLCAEKEYNITELQKKIKISYPHVHNHVSILREAKLIETYEKTNSKGKNIMIRSKYKILKDGSFKSIKIKK
jgi:predicted transcriptional regulator